MDKVQSVRDTATILVYECTEGHVATSIRPIGIIGWRLECELVGGPTRTGRVKRHLARLAGPIPAGWLPNRVKFDGRREAALPVLPWLICTGVENVV